MSSLSSSLIARSNPVSSLEPTSVLWCPGVKLLGAGLYTCQFACNRVKCDLVRSASVGCMPVRTMLSRSIYLQRPMVQLLHRWCLRHAGSAGNSQHAPTHAAYSTETSRTPFANRSCPSISADPSPPTRGSLCDLPANNSRSFSSWRRQLLINRQPLLTSSSASCTNGATISSAMQNLDSIAGTLASVPKARSGGGIGRGFATSPEPQQSVNTVACPPGNTLVVDLRQSSRDVSLVANEDPSHLMFVSWPV